MDRLLRLTARKAELSPCGIRWPIDWRVWSPEPTGSTLMTFAPRSPRSWQQDGPAITCVRSITVTCSRARVMVALSSRDVRVSSGSLIPRADRTGHAFRRAGRRLARRRGTVLQPGRHQGADDQVHDRVEQRG